MDFSVFHEFDYGIFRFFGETIQNSVMNVVAEIFTFFGGEEFIIPMAIVGLVLMAFKKTRKYGMAIFFAILIGTLVTNLVMKPIFSRPRPFIYYKDDPAYWSWYTFSGSHIENAFTSFPSGHTTAAFELGVVLFLVLSKKYSWIFPIFSAFVGLSRIYLMVHYPTDVIAGAVIGTCAGIIAYFLMKAVMKKIENSKFAEFDLAETLKKKKA